MEGLRLLPKNLPLEMHLLCYIYVQSGTGLISLEEFKAMVNRKQKLSGQTSQELPDSPVPKQLV